MRRLLLFLLALLAIQPHTTAYASGMLPETSVVIVNEADGEGSMTLRNTENYPLLLYTTLQDVPEDSERLLIVTPPVARVDPGKLQLVRFVLATTTPLKTERLKRVTFEGIPPADTLKSRIQLTVRQNLPVIIRPRGLKVDLAPWKQLTWSQDGGVLQVSNPSPYVVRLSQQILLMPSLTRLVLPKPWLLPGEQRYIPIPVIKGTKPKADGVRIFPASTYGFSVGEYDAPLSPARTLIR